MANSYAFCNLSIGDHLVRLELESSGVESSVSIWSSSRLCSISIAVLSIYINGLVDELKKSSCGVECDEDIIPGLLFADDTSLFASDGPGIRKSLDVLVRYSNEWWVKINVPNPNYAHMTEENKEK